MWVKASVTGCTIQGRACVQPVQQRDTAGIGIVNKIQEEMVCMSISIKEYIGYFDDNKKEGEEKMAKCKPRKKGSKKSGGKKSSK